MNFSSNVLVPLPLACFVNSHDIKRLIFIVFTCVSLLLNFGLVIGNFVRWAGFKIFTGHDVTEDFCFDWFFVEIGVTDDIGTGDMHLPFNRFGTGAENLQSCKILQDNITNEFEFLVVLAFLMFEGFWCQNFLNVRNVYLFQQVGIKKIGSLIFTELSVIIDDANRHFGLAKVEHWDRFVVSFNCTYVQSVVGLLNCWDFTHVGELGSVQRLVETFAQWVIQFLWGIWTT